MVMIVVSDMGSNLVEALIFFRLLLPIKLENLLQRSFFTLLSVLLIYFSLSFFNDSCVFQLSRSTL